MHLLKSHFHLFRGLKKHICQQSTPNIKQAYAAATYEDANLLFVIISTHLTCCYLLLLAYTAAYVLQFYSKYEWQEGGELFKHHLPSNPGVWLIFLWRKFWIFSHTSNRRLNKKQGKPKHGTGALHFFIKSSSMKNTCKDRSLLIFFQLCVIFPFFLSIYFCI